ncbi:MAG: TnpV protein [Nakamurella sp.]
MNEYGRRALEHWQRTKPRELSTIPEPEAFFSTLGETVASQVDELTDQLAGADPADETFLGKVGRLRAAKSQAEEMVLAELVYSTTPEGPDDEEDLEDSPAHRRWKEWEQSERQEQLEHKQQMQDAADQDWRDRTGQSR